MDRRKSSGVREPSLYIGVETGGRSQRPVSSGSRALCCSLLLHKTTMLVYSCIEDLRAASAVGVGFWPLVGNGRGSCEFRSEEASLVMR